MRPSASVQSMARRLLPRTAHRQSLSTIAAHHRAAEFVFVRHGESEGNVAYERSLQGDHSLYQGEFLDVC